MRTQEGMSLTTASVVDIMSIVEHQATGLTGLLATKQRCVGAFVRAWRDSYLVCQLGAAQRRRNDPGRVNASGTDTFVQRDRRPASPSWGRLNVGS